MTRTQYYTACSLDGYIADAANSLDWLFQFGDPEGGDYEQFIALVGAIAMGSSTYEWLLDNHLRPGTPDAQPWPYAQPTWLFSRRSLPIVEGADIRLVQGDVRPVHEAMRAAADGKNIWLMGGGELVGQFHDHGLLDELFVQMAAVTLGAGALLLPRRIMDPPLELVSAGQWGEAFVRLHYRVRKPG